MCAAEARCSLDMPVSVPSVPALFYTIYPDKFFLFFLACPQMHYKQTILFTLCLEANAVMELRGVLAALL